MVKNLCVPLCLNKTEIMTNEKKLPEIFVHSANPVGADNIKGLLDNFTKHCS